MDGARLVSLVQRGYRIASERVGVPFDHYRPNRLHGPLSELSRLGTVTALFDRDARFPLTSHPRHGEPVRHGIVDGTLIEHGDYLVPGGPGETVFVAEPGDVHATLCIACNTVLMLRRVPPPMVVGANGYRAVAANESSLQDGWPASVLSAGRGGTGFAHLPGALPVGDWTILLPRCAALPAIRNGDVLEGRDGTRYGVQRAESSAAGWRIAARTETAT